MNEDLLAMLDHLESLCEYDPITANTMDMINRLCDIVRDMAMHQPKVLVPIEGGCPCGRFYK